MEAAAEGRPNDGEQQHADGSGFLKVGRGKQLFLIFVRKKTSAGVSLSGLDESFWKGAVVPWMLSFAAFMIVVMIFAFFFEGA